MSKSAIYTAMNTSTTVESGSVLPLGTTIRRFGYNCALSGNGILIEGAGYYSVDASITLTPSTANVVTVELYKDGVAVPGASASVTATASDTVNLSLTALLREYCCNSSSTLTLVMTGAESTVVNVAMKVEKL